MIKAYLIALVIYLLPLVILLAARSGISLTYIIGSIAGIIVYRIIEKIEDGSQT